MFTATKAQLQIVDSLIRHDLIDKFESIIVDGKGCLVISFTDLEGEHYQWDINDRGSADISWSDAAIGDWRSAVMGLTTSQMQKFNLLNAKGSFIKLNKFELLPNDSVRLDYVERVNGLHNCGWAPEY